MLMRAAISVLLLQVVLISAVMFLNGTVSSLDQNAIDTLYRNAENRAITLENQMVHNWTNLAPLEQDITAQIDKYLRMNPISPETLFASRDHQNALLFGASDAMLDALRLTGTTGVFLFFIPEGFEPTDAASLRGLYYRDPDPVLTPVGYEDVLFVKGHASIARKHNIQLAPTWSEMYGLSAEHTDAWRAIFASYMIAKAQPDLSASDMAYWSAPHHLDPNSKLDSNPFIGYTRPLLYNGRLVGVLGIEMQVDQLVKYFPSRDISTTGVGGYLLTCREQSAGDGSARRAYAATGSYARKLVEAGGVALLPTDVDYLHNIDNPGMEPASAALQPLKLYNSYAPFCGDEWALAAIDTDGALYQSANRLRTGLLLSSLIAIAAGLVLMYGAIGLVTRPLIRLTEQIRGGSPDAPVSVPTNSGRETELLCETINDMKRKRRDMESALREERERYMLALESATSTFIEYDVMDDQLAVYSFAERDGKSSIESVEIDGFSARLPESRMCPPEDIAPLRALLAGETREPVELRLAAQLFEREGIKPQATDAGYLWFLMKATAIRGAGDALVKTVASARPITEQKLLGLAQAEAKRRDPTTGLYNREYGEKLIARMPATRDGYACAISLVGFDQALVRCGRVYSALVARQAARALMASLSGASGSEPLAMRYADDEILLMMDSCSPAEARARLSDALAAVRNRLADLGADPPLMASAGVARLTGAGMHACIDRARGLMRLGGIRFADDASTGNATAAPPAPRAVECAAKVEKDSAVGLAFSLFEHTTDIDATLRMLLDALGELFSLRQIAVFSSDQDFGTSQVTHQWRAPGLPKLSGDLAKSSQQDFARMTGMFGEQNALILSPASVQSLPDSVRASLCAGLTGGFSALCCAMLENGAHIGRILFVAPENAPDGESPWSAADEHSLMEVTKVVAAHISLARSNLASRAKSEFLSNMSHEIRTPMNAIIGMTQIAKDSMADNPPRLRDSLDKIDMSAKHLLALINDVLDMSRIESGKMTVEVKPLSLDALCRDLDTLMRQQLEGKGIAFTPRLVAANPMVLGDEQKLRQVLINLLGNAGKFTPSGGKIALTIEQQGSVHDGRCEYRFSVRDSGVGIAKQDQLRIFNAFEQSESANASAGRPQGTGLGLAISSSLIRAMGGRIEIDSAPGCGSEFFFTLAMDSAAPDNGQSAPTERPDYQGYFKGKRVLIVEDNEINLEIASYIVENAGFLAETAANGRLAVDMFLASAPGYYDVIFMDISMPVMDGLTATREIRKSPNHPSARSIPIIAMTANAFGEDTRKSIEAGMNGHIAKPIDVQALYQLLDKLLVQKK